MKTIKQQLEEGKREINVHLNVDTIKTNSEKFHISTDLSSRDWLKAMFREGFLIVERRTEGIF